MTLLEQHKLIKSRADFVVFVGALREDLQKNGEAWENNTLDRFLEALGAWVNDMDGYYRNQGNSTPEFDWKAFGDILMAARMYE